jgi:lipid II:glycine glycyltransferase (peptidoglycan interpeptide bridge formation enzyme)
VKGGAYILIKPDRMKASFFIQVEAKSAEKAKSILKTYTDLVRAWQGSENGN